MKVPEFFRHTSADVLPMQPDPEKAKAVDAVHSAESAFNELGEKVARLSSAYEAKTEQLGRAALAAEETGDMSAYAKLQAEASKLKDELERARAAHKAADTRLREAKATLHRIGKAGVLKTASRLGNARAKAITELQQNLEGVAKAYRKIAELNDKIALSWPYGTAPQGALIYINEISEAIADELFRVHPTDVLARGQAPLLPGARRNLLNSDPRQMQSLGEKIEQANAYMLKLVEVGPELSNVKAVPQPFPQLTPERQSSETKIDARGYVPERRDLSEYLPGGKP